MPPFRTGTSYAADFSPSQPTFAPGIESAFCIKGGTAYHHLNVLDNEMMLAALSRWMRLCHQSYLPNPRRQRYRLQPAHQQRWPERSRRQVGIVDGCRGGSKARRTEHWTDQRPVPAAFQVPRDPAVGAVQCAPRGACARVVVWQRGGQRRRSRWKGGSGSSGHADCGAVALRELHGCRHVPLPQRAPAALGCPPCRSGDRQLYVDAATVKCDPDDPRGSRAGIRHPGDPVSTAATAGAASQDHVSMRCGGARGIGGADFGPVSASRCRTTQSGRGGQGEGQWQSSSRAATAGSSTARSMRARCCSASRSRSGRLCCRIWATNSRASQAPGRPPRSSSPSRKRCSTALHFTSSSARMHFFNRTALSVNIALWWSVKGRRKGESQHTLTGPKTLTGRKNECTAFARSATVMVEKRPEDDWHGRGDRSNEPRWVRAAISG
ncbi:hypothetical protein L1887_46820 [Cichorium endivia]|nr:hypothetical protein L1887_46820 [Cichorium endivia]